MDNVHQPSVHAQVLEETLNPSWVKHIEKFNVVEHVYDEFVVVYEGVF